MDLNHIRLSQIAEIGVGLPTRNFGPESRGNPIPVISVASLRDSGMDRDSLSMAEDFGKVEAAYRVRTGDLLIPSRSTSLYGAVVPRELEGEVFNATVLRIRCHPELNPHLLLTYFLHPEGKEAVMALSQSSTHQWNLTASGLSKLTIPLPPLGKQKQIVAMIEIAEQAYQSALEAAKTRRRIGLDIAFKQMNKPI